MKNLLYVLLILFISCNKSEKLNNNQVIAYYAGDGDSIEEFNLNGVDHLIYSFLHLKGNKLAIDNEKDSITLLKIIKQKNKYPNLKVLVSLGGWGGCETCSDIFNTKQGRDEFAKSSAKIIEFYNADGIDLDWEYPAISGYPGHKFQELDRDNFTDLIRLLRKYMKKNDVLSFAAGGSGRFIDNSIDWKAVVPLVDNINIMSYDFVGSGSKKTGHHTSLLSTNEQNRSADFAIKYLIEKGIPSYKIIIGAAFYIKTFKDVSDINNGIFQEATYNKSYNQINFGDVKDNFEFFWDSVAKAPYAYDSKNKIFATFDDKKSISLKAKYAKENNLGGIMFWQLMNDKKSDGLLKTMVNEMKGY
ncbi:MAG: glycoside hydrolase family 18 protein [Flavobacteriales bacterium]|jgi:chitinase|tara:strand:+ start:80 stop:1156 length:1077 start_codon:yes stop_codon:yes gene_type:complete